MVRRPWPSPAVNRCCRCSTFESPDLLVDIGGLQELKEAAATPSNIRIGALTTHAAIEDGRLPEAFGGLMQTVAAKISYRAVRNYGTIGGSVALADPAADWPSCLMALGAQVRISGLNGTRSEPIGDFVQGQYSTSPPPTKSSWASICRAPTRPCAGAFSGRPKERRVCEFHRVRRCARSWRAGVGGARRRCGTSCSLPTVGEHIKAGRSDRSVRAAIAEDVASHLPADDPYLVRLHTSTVLRAVREMQSK